MLRNLQNQKKTIPKSRQPCYAQPIQAKLIPDCKDSVFALLYLYISTSSLF